MKIDQWSTDHRSEEQSLIVEIERDHGESWHRPVIWADSGAATAATTIVFTSNACRIDEMTAINPYKCMTYGFRFSTPLCFFCDEEPVISHSRLL